MPWNYLKSNNHNNQQTRLLHKETNNRKQSIDRSINESVNEPKRRKNKRGKKKVIVLNIIQRYYSKIYILLIIDCCYMHMHAWSSHSVLYIKHADLLSGFFFVCVSHGTLNGGKLGSHTRVCCCGWNPRLVPTLGGDRGQVFQWMDEWISKDRVQHAIHSWQSERVPPFTTG